MIHALLGFLLGVPVMWLYSRLANVSALGDIKSHKRAVMKRAFTHTGSFAELLAMQREILILSLRHLRLVFLPALFSCLPLVAFVAWRPEVATPTFALGILGAYIVAKWRFRI